MTAAHVALLGDSIFDNGAYTRGEPDVAASSPAEGRTIRVRVAALPQRPRATPP